MKHLGTKQLNAIRNRLAALNGDLRTAIRAELIASDEQHYRDLAGQVTDSADQALASTLVDLGAAISDRHITELREVEAATTRLADGSYGMCADCGVEIAFARLEVQPTALRCITCQEQHEKRYAHTPTPSL